MTQAEKVTSCLDTGIFMFLLLVLVVLVVKDFRQPLLMWLKHSFPREFSLLAEFFTDLTTFWAWLYSLLGGGGGGGQTEL